MSDFMSDLNKVEKQILAAAKSYNFDVDNVVVYHDTLSRDAKVFLYRDGASVEWIKFSQELLAEYTLLQLCNLWFYNLRGGKMSNLPLPDKSSPPIRAQGGNW